MSLKNGLNGDSGICTPELRQKIDEWLNWDQVSKHRVHIELTQIDKCAFVISFSIVFHQNEVTREEINELVRQHNYLKLEKLLLERLSFGTAGLRAAMRAGYNSMNDLVVIQSAQGLAKYVLKCFPSAEDRARGVVFGFDGRYNSKRYAKRSNARVRRRLKIERFFLFIFLLIIVTSHRFAELSASVFLNEGIPVYLYSEMVATPFVPFAISHKHLLAGVMVTASHNPKEDNGYKVYWSNGAQITTPHDKNIHQHILANLE